MLRRNLTLIVLLGAAAASVRADDLLCLEEDFLVRLSTENGTFSGQRSIKGVRGTRTILAIDTRPSTGVLYGVGMGRLHTIDAESGWGTVVGPQFGEMISEWASAQLEFDATGDVAYVLVTGKPGPNFQPNHMMRVDANTGELLSSTPLEQRALAYPEGDPGFGSPLRNLGLAHYVVPGGALFGVDAARATLFRVGWPGGIPSSTEAPVATTVGPLVNVPMRKDGDPVAFEIQSDGTAFLVGGDRSFFLGVWRVDLATGAATIVGDTQNHEFLSVTSPPVALSEPIRELAVTRTVMRHRFEHPRFSSFVLRGRLPASAAGWDGKVVRACIGNGAEDAQVNNDHPLDRRGRARTWGRSFAIGSKEKDGFVPFVLKYTGTSIPDFLLNPSSESGPRTMTVDLLVDGHPFRGVFRLDFVRGKKWGTATLSRQQP